MAQRDPAAAWSSFLESAGREMLAISYWFDPPPGWRRSAVRIRISGRRSGSRRPGPRDQFVCYETVDDVEPSSGRISVTARVRDIEPGDWVTTATVVDAPAGGPARRGRRGPAQPPIQLHLAGWSWRRWSLLEAPPAARRTCLAPAIHVPGMIPYIWGPMVFAGVILGLLLQMLIVRHLQLSPPRVLAVSIAALLAGAVGAKAWYAVVRRREHSYNGWCIQGFLVAFALVAPATAALVGVPIGTFFDISASGVFAGAVVGRLGCFLAGCCSGRPTTARWGVWSSDQRVGRRRIPTQLLEAALAAVVSAVSLAALLSLGPRHGTIFLGAAAAYTLLRQGILRLRLEQRESPRLGALVAAGAAMVLAGDVVVIAVLGW